MPANGVSSLSSTYRRYTGSTVRRLRIEHTWPLLFAMGVAVWALLVPPLMATSFPSDGQDPRVAGTAELLQAVCPDRVNGIGCRACPEFTPFRDDDTFHLEVTAVTRGHFLSPSSEDAVLSTGGCESHQENFGGAILLTRRSQQWKMVSYWAGVKTSRCHKVPLRDRRDALVCIDEFFDHGYNGTVLYTEDLRSPKAGFEDGGPQGVFFAVSDTSGCCSFSTPSPGDPVAWGSIERVEFRTPTAGGPPAISVTATSGKGVWTADAIEARARGGVAFESRLPPLKRYRIDFIFDGQDYKPAPASAAIAQIFADR